MVLSHVAALSPTAGPLAFRGGAASWLVHLLIWRLIWRLGLMVWRIPTFGPAICLLLVIAAVALGVLKSRRGTLRLGRRRGGMSGYGTGRGPRDW